MKGANMGEKVVEVIPASLKKELFKTEAWNFILTNSRLIGAKFRSNLVKEEAFIHVYNGCR